MSILSKSINYDKYDLVSTREMKSFNEVNGHILP
jgi:hypothetical protein